MKPMPWCRYAEKYRELGVAEFGHCLSCCRDEPFAEGFNSKIRFERSQTIMEGAPY
ncbi:MAG: L-2-amino-thiazoline-4-carboxylic acid hydrolase [Desulfotignum sp.]|nr:L-2-amino-thiazoline-4-carboxylic acid hydrolase [Desulfotignum sp.]MCF8086997.1 L-2-amino-thiazoline-4-carboxylic acid hydrolase [Desulfotignum sp.]